MFRSGNSSKSINSPSQRPKDKNTNNQQQPKSLLKSKSLLYRNRSLKQFFGDLPALNVFVHEQVAQPKCAQKQNSKGVGKQPFQKGRKQAIIEDEYLIKRREKPTKRNKEQVPNNLNHESKYKRNNIVSHQSQGEAATHRTQTHPHFYDPSPYQWRKSKSKSKHDIVPQSLPDSEPLVVQSQYYPTPKSSRNYNNKHMEYNAAQQPKRQQTRSNSSDSVKQRKQSHLKPRVAKHIFQGKAVKKKSEDGDKRLLFTFGI